jgi:Cft2 family RNA processing exonuclease
MNSKINYNIISTGSQGNAVIVNSVILIDCGVTFKAIRSFSKNIKLVLLTHIHSDHFKTTTIKILARERPTLRFACCSWLVKPLIDCGVVKSNIDVLELNKMYGYGICNIIPVPLVHNVPNCGYKIHFPKGKVFYATDTNNLNGITARHYDLYLIEANYEDEEIKERIQEKREKHEFVYELQVIKNHLSKEKCNDFIYKNIGTGGEYVYLHSHVAKEGETVDNNSKNYGL